MTELMTNLQAWWDCHMMMAAGLKDMCTDMGDMCVGMKDMCADMGDMCAGRKCW